MEVMAHVVNRRNDPYLQMRWAITGYDLQAIINSFTDFRRARREIVCVTIQGEQNISDAILNALNKLETFTTTQGINSKIQSVFLACLLYTSRCV